MKRTIKNFLLLLMLSVISLFFSLNVTATVSKSVYTHSKWSDGSPIIDGVVSSNHASLDSEAIGGGTMTCLNIKDGAYGESVGIVHSSIEGEAIPFNDVRYIRYNYYYESDTPYTGRAALTFKASEFNLLSDCIVYSCETVKSGEWAFLTFVVGDALDGEIFPGAIVPEFCFFPFMNAESGSLNGDRMGIFQLQLLSSDSPIATSAIEDGVLVERFTVKFQPGRIDTTGSMESYYAYNGEEITLPECAYEREGYKFNGWICSVDSKIYNPGDKYTITKRLQNNSFETGRTDFIADWKKVTFDSGEYDTDYATINYSNVWGGLVKPMNASPYTYADVEKNYDFNGVETLRIIFKPNDKDANQIIKFDGHTWDTLPLDIARFKYVIMPYYFKAKNENLDFGPPAFSLLPGTAAVKALQKSVTVMSKVPLVANKWSFLLFEFDVFRDFPECLSPDAGTTVVKQCHIKPFGEKGTAKCSNLSEGDEFYFGNFVFLSDVPSTVPEMLPSFVEGYNDGTFRPHNYVTNAEAAVMLAKAIGAKAFLDDAALETSYSDLEGSAYDWCRPYIACLEKMNILAPNKGDLFRPGEYIDELSFIKNITRAKAGGSTGESLGKLAETASAAKKVTRARAVGDISNFIRDSVNKSMVQSENETLAYFSDVNKTSLYFNDIRLANLNLISFTDSNGKGRTLDVLTVAGADSNSVSSELLAIGDRYVSSLDITTAQRIEEIRNTKSVYTQKNGGKTVYVSSTSGSEASAGLSESNPRLVKTLDDVNSILLNPGDVLLFKRGDTFRGSVNAKPGVTYSAYGVGAKPILTRSPENGSGGEKWILVNPDDTSGKKIWKYYNESFVDTGAINLIDSSGKHTVAYKEIPSYTDGKFWNRGFKPGENSSYPDGVEFDYMVQLDRDLEFFHRADSLMKTDNYTTHGGVKVSITTPNLTVATGPIYLRCDKGNPGELYPRIEFNLRNNCFAVGNTPGVTVDNLCILYFGSHGVGAGSVNNLTVTNCEIGWGGGSIQNYQTAANYSKPGTVVRFGNGIEIYGGLINYTIDNCYVYEIYDAGITHQLSGHATGNYYMKNVVYTNNVLEKCIYNIEYFMGKYNVKSSDGTIRDYERYMDEVYFGNNICRMAGYGWGVQRPDGNVPSNIKGWNMHNLSNRYLIEDNIFDRTVDFKGTGSDYTICTGSSFESSTPFFKNNTIVQVPGRILVANGTVSNYRCNTNAENVFLSFGGIGNKVYFTTDDKAEYSDKIIW